MIECSLLALDFSQIELRVAAHESQDPTMLDIYRHDGDIHMTTACHMFGLPPEKIDDKAHRRPAKTTNFGTIYLISAKGLWAQFQHEGLTQFTEDDCQDFLDSWRETYPGFFDWVEEIKAEARRTGMVRDMFGRIRWIPELQSSLKYVREAGIRQGVNAPIQCLPENSRIRTPNGYETIKSLTKLYSFDVWTGSEWSIAKAVPMGKGEIVRLLLSDGATFECDTAHNILVQRTAWPEWVNVMDLKGGDILVNSLVPDCGHGERVESPEFWYWIGRYYGDGHLFYLNIHDKHPRSGKEMKSSRRRVDWYFGGCKKGEHEKLLKFLKDEGESCSVGEEYKNKNSKSVLRVCSSTFIHRMMYYGVEPNEVSWDKRVADIVFRLDETRKRSFVQGYFDADGTRPKKYPNGLSAYSITSVNHGLLYDTLLIARAAGIRCNIKGPYHNNRARDFYRLNLYVDDPIRRFVKLETTNRIEEVFTLQVDNPKHSFDSEGVISRNSGAGGILKEAMRRLTPLVNQWQNEYGVVCRPLLQIHDELIFEVEDEWLPVIAPQFHEVMCTAVELTVPVKVDCEVGKNWKELEAYDLG